jgi:hypothetical protein
MGHPDENAQSTTDAPDLLTGHRHRRLRHPLHDRAHLGMLAYRRPYLAVTLAR